MDKAYQSIYPHFLENFANLQTHFKEQFSELTSQERGDRFAEFVRRIVPYTQSGKGFEDPIPRQKSHDDGVDLEAIGIDGNDRLFIQSKYTIRDKASFGEIISKFQDYYQRKSAFGSDSLFAWGGVVLEEEEEAEKTLFQIVTLHDLSRIIGAYEESKLSSKTFYNGLVESGRLEIVDGPKILHLLQIAYRKTHLLPPNFELNFASDLLVIDDVYLGIISSRELTDLYNNYGDSLFFENLRDYLQDTEVNEAIVQTVKHSPSQLLARNNGLVFKATDVESVASRKLVLHEGSVVNGCQTTLSVVRHAKEECYLAVKVVCTSREDAWDITRAANNQNRVGRFDLELAQYIRPQIVKKAAAEMGYRYRDNQGAFAVIDVIYHDDIVFEELRYMYVGLFSDKPNNIFDKTYMNLLPEVMEMFYKEDPSGQNLLDQIFTIYLAADKIASVIRNRINLRSNPSHTYQRFFQPDKSAYRAYFTLLAACAASNTDISVDTNSIQEKYELISDFLLKSMAVIENDASIFNQYYKLSVQTVSSSIEGDDKRSIKQYLWKQMRNTSFDVWLERIHQAADLAADLEI